MYATRAFSFAISSAIPIAISCFSRKLIMNTESAIPVTGIIDAPMVIGIAIASKRLMIEPRSLLFAPFVETQTGRERLRMRAS